MILAPNKVVIGDDVKFAPNCGIYAAGHPFDTKDRKAGIEYTWPVKVGNNVWIGAGCSIIGGVSIGDDSVIYLLILSIIKHSLKRFFFFSVHSPSCLFVIVSRYR